MHEEEVAATCSFIMQKGGRAGLSALLISRRGSVPPSRPPLDSDNLCMRLSSCHLLIVARLHRFPSTSIMVAACWKRISCYTGFACLQLNRASLVFHSTELQSGHVLEGQSERPLGARPE